LAQPDRFQLVWPEQLGFTPGQVDILDISPWLGLLVRPHLGQKQSLLMELSSSCR